MHAGSSGEKIRLMGVSHVSKARFYFLQSDNGTVNLMEHLENPCRIISTVPAHATVNIVGSHGQS
jgi:hypothetical protein